SGIEPCDSARKEHQRECHADYGVCFDNADYELGDHKRHGAIPPQSSSRKPRSAVDTERTDRCCHFNLARRGRLFSPRLQQLGHQAGPPRLVRCAHAPSRVTVKVLVKQHMVAKVWVVLKATVAAEYGPLAVRIPEEDPVQAGGELAGDLVDRVIPTGTRRTLHFEIVAVVVVELLERFDEQVIDRHPDRSAPIRVSAKESRRGFAGLILDREALPIPLERVWTIAVVSREG